MKRSPEIHKSTTVSQTIENQSFEQIVAKVNTLDQQNKKLISIADSIMKTSFLKPQQPTPTIISQFQQDIRSSFNQLIEGIKDFFINIDTKIQTIGRILTQKLREHDSQLNKMTPPMRQSDKYDFLMKKMTMLQQNLKQTQSNENKLIAIIQNMNRKHMRYDQEPTMVRSQQKHTEPENAHHSQNSFRLFSINSHPNSLAHGKNQQVKYNMIESSVEDSRQHHIQQRSNQLYAKNSPKTPQLFLPQYFCMPKQQSSACDNMQMVKGPQQLQSSNRIHRLSNLMRNLKSQ